MLLITGASGFIGRRLCEIVVNKGIGVRAAVRNHSSSDSFVKTEQIITGDIGSDTEWRESLEDVDCIVHLAGRAHVTRDDVTNSFTEFRRVNVEGTLNLARQAGETGVRRFVFISSIGVNGSCNLKPFTETDIPHPVEPYAISKFEAEEGLRQIAESTGMEMVIIRPPLVYGPGAPGNFGRLMRVVNKRLPLPLGAVHNKRSLVALDNLVDLIMTCITHPAATNQIFLAGDGEDQSTTALLRSLGNALGKPVWLIPIPLFLLKLGAALIGKPELFRQLCESLQVDISKARKLLGWSPLVNVDEYLKLTAEHFLESRR